jgi:hypothetical protein
MTMSFTSSCSSATPVSQSVARCCGVRSSVTLLSSTTQMLFSSWQICRAHVGGWVLRVLRSVDRSVRLGRLGVSPECLMAEVGKRLDYNGVCTTERWINTQGESACQALRGKGRKGLCKVFQPKRMRCRDSTKYAQRGCIGEVAEALQSIQLGPSDTRSQSYRLLAKLSSLIY